MDDALLNWLSALEAPLQELDRDLRKVKSDGAKLQVATLCAIRLASEQLLPIPLSDEAKHLYEFIVATRVAEKCTASLS